MSPRLVFVYGTLRDPDLRTAALGRALDPRSVGAALAPGYRTVFYPGRIYPAIVPAPGAVAVGQLLIGLSGFEIEVLDAFEGPEYRRTPLPVLIEQELHEAEAYLPIAAVPADAPEWSLDRWRIEHKPAILPEDGAAAAAIRARLLAARPN